MAKKSFEAKTEKPTERRKRQARREGQNARSSEVGVAFSFLGALLALRIFAPGAISVVADRSREIFAGAGSGFSGSGVGEHVMAMFAGALVPFLVLAVATGVTAGVTQVGFTVAPKAFRPKLSHLKKGMSRFKPGTMGWELLRSTLKLGLLAIIVWQPIADGVERLTTSRSLGSALSLTGSQIWDLFFRAAILAVLVGAIDYGINRRRVIKEMKMTRSELKEEMRNVEGDQAIKARRKKRHAELSRNRMIAEVGSADVVVTNPTRLAVALSYGADDVAPVVVAKGANRMAARIRAEAYRNGVTVVEQKPLARALFRTTQVGQYVPTTLFEAVAVVLAVAYRRRRRVPA